MAPVDKVLLELWGQTLLEIAKIAKGPQGFFDLFYDGFAQKKEKPDAVQEQFIELCRKMFGKEGIEAFNAVMKEFYENAGVVPRAQYNELHEKYEELKGRLRELEKRTEELKMRLARVRGTPSDLLEEWRETARTYTDINRQFFNEFSKFFK